MGTREEGKKGLRAGGGTTARARPERKREEGLRATGGVSGVLAMRRRDEGEGTTEDGTKENGRKRDGRKQEETKRREGRGEALSRCERECERATRTRTGVGDVCGMGWDSSRRGARTTTGQCLDSTRYRPVQGAMNEGESACARLRMDGWTYPDLI